MTGSALGESRLIAGRYELEARIGKGGIAEVWRARHLALNSFVAIKFLQGTSAQNESTRRRFTTEAQVTAQLKSQHAVQVFDFGITEDGHPYLVMELLEGETLGRRIEREGRLGILETARILGQSARALHRAHQLGIVHRDFKPENIVIDHDDEGRDFVKVVDFGIAKLVGDLDPPSNDVDPKVAMSAPSASFTKTGSMLGTPFYMAPEQVRNSANVDLRADIWAFGVVAFECLTGCTPFTGDTVLELFRQIESGTYPEPDKLEPSVPPGFSEWFRTACAPDPANRFSDATLAWKRLTVALECGRIDIDPSMTGHTLSSGAKRVVVGTSEVGADGNAITLDATAKRRVEPRQGRPRKNASMAHVPRASAAGTTRPSESRIATDTTAEDTGTHPASVSVDRGPPVAPSARRRSRTPWIALPLLALAGAIGWRMSTRSASGEHPPASPGPESAVPITRAPIAASPPIETPAPPASSAPAAAPSTSPASSTTAPSAKGHVPRAHSPSPTDSAEPASPKPRETAEPTVVTTPPVASSTPPVAAPHPAPSSSTADPESYR